MYNRGIGGFTTTELLEAMDECILELQPAHLFLNIGTNDLNGPDYDRAAMLGRYEAVSYTHLDVYKRQGWLLPVWPRAVRE